MELSDIDRILSIEYGMEMLREQEDAVKKATYIRDTIYAQLVDQVSKIASRYTTIETFVRAASFIHDGMSGHTHETEYEQCLYAIREDFCNSANDKPHVQIVDIAVHSDYAVTVVIEYDYGKFYAVKIPIHCNLDSENIRYANFGQYTVMTVDIDTDNCGIVKYREGELLAESHDTNVIAEALEKHWHPDWKIW